MTHIVLFHSGLGLTRHVLAFADVLRADGHEVTAPDLYDGEVFDNLAAAAQALAFTRPGALGTVLMHACLPPAMLGIEAWPGALRAQIHWAEADPWVDATAVDALADLAPAGACERFTYPGGAHLFGFDGYEDYDAESAALMAQRVRGFVEELA